MQFGWTLTTKKVCAGFFVWSPTSWSDGASCLWDPWWSTMQVNAVNPALSDILSQLNSQVYYSKILDNDNSRSCKLSLRFWFFLEGPNIWNYLITQNVQPGQTQSLTKWGIKSKGNELIVHTSKLKNRNNIFHILVKGIDTLSQPVSFCPWCHLLVALCMALTTL